MLLFNTEKWSWVEGKQHGSRKMAICVVFPLQK